MITQVLNDIILILGLSIVVLFICHRLRIPTIVGLLLTGVLAGPHGLGLLKAVHEVEILAEIGIVLLLFTIGIEFSLKKLLQIKKSILMGGSLQVLLTLMAAFFIFRQLGQTFGSAMFISFLVALSSTAIVLNLFQERGEVDSPQGRTALAILIFQDIIIVPMILFTPLLATAAENQSQSIILLTVKGIGIILLVLIGARWIVPQALYQIAKTRQRELFLLSVVVICLGIAWLTSLAGLSLALGAFLAGLIISESEYSHQALGNILPFRDVFTSFFFVSIGMLLDIGFLLQQPVFILLITLSVLTIKSIIAGFTTLLLGFPIRMGILVGLALSQVGEFSFILSKTGIEHGLITEDIYQIFLSVSVLTMAASPFIITLAPRLANGMLKVPLPKRLKSGLYPTHKNSPKEDQDHLIIIGYGVNGRNLARAARAGSIPYVIIEMNPEVVREEKEKGESIFYGDATHESVLKHANIKESRIVVVAINDPAATRRITEITRRISPQVYIIVRTPYLQEMKPLLELGADEVIPEEFETSVEIFTRVLVKYLLPRDEIEKFVAEVRSDGYEMFRTRSNTGASLSDLKLHLTDVEIYTFRVGEKSPLVGKSLAKIEFRKKYEITVLAIHRDSQILSNPRGDMKIFTNDILYVLGSPQNISKIGSLFHNIEKK